MWWNTYVGIPFKEKGREPNALDCWGLVKYVYEKEKGIILPSYDHCYTDTNNRPEVSHTITRVKEAGWFDVETPQPFDVIILRMAGLPMHVGLVTKPNFMIHCSRGVGVSHEKYTDKRWNNKVLGFARHAGS